MTVKEQRILFILLLISSTLLHLGVISYSGDRGSNLLTAPLSQAPISMKINIRKPVAQKEAPQQRKSEMSKRAKTEVVNKKQRKISRKKEPINTPKVATSGPQMTTKNFDALIDHYTQPSYPRLAIRRGLTGIVTLTLWIKGDGQIDKIEITKSSGHKSLDESALAAVKEWRFKKLSTLAEKTALFKVEKRIVYQLD